MPAMVYERLPVADVAAAQLGCMLLDDRALLTLEVLEGACECAPFVSYDLGMSSKRPMLQRSRSSHMQRCFKSTRAERVLTKKSS